MYFQYKLFLSMENSLFTTVCSWHFEKHSILHVCCMKKPLVSYSLEKYMYLETFFKNWKYMYYLLKFMAFYVSSESVQLHQHDGSDFYIIIHFCVSNYMTDCLRKVKSWSSCLCSKCNANLVLFFNMWYVTPYICLSH